jgi:ZIP family zinc transporter
MESNSVFLAFTLSCIAGLSPCIGSLFSLLTNRRNMSFLSFTLGFSAGVMLYISFMEVLPHAREILVELLGEKGGTCGMIAGFFGGIGLMTLLDRLIPAVCHTHSLKPHNPASLTPDTELNQRNSRLRRIGIFTALAVVVHNVPEGMVTFMATLEDPAFGVSITAAIIFHHIPAGIAIATPIYYSGSSRKKALLYAFLSGMTGPLGALLGYFILIPLCPPEVFGILLSTVAGIMVFISLDELLPAAKEYGAHKLCTYGLVTGMAVMAVSLLFLE